MTAAEKPRILLVNDDSIHGDGILLLERIVRQFTDDIWVVAPDEEKSGASHSLSLTQPVRVRQIDDRHWAVKGTPTDSALLAIYEIMKDNPPTVLLSGINRGANLAEDVTYSGTAAGAMEGCLLGVRSIALSQVFTIGGQPYWDTAERYTPQVLEKLLTCDWEPGTFVNVNFPDCPADAVSGVRVTRQGQRPPGSFRPMQRIDARNVPYYWIKLSYADGGEDPETDLEAMRDNAVSITPMMMDLTANPFRARLGDLFA